MKQTLIISILLFAFTYSFGQSANFKAQGYYYKAKEFYNNNRYSNAVEYINKSKAELGGTNDLLQYLHIMCYYKMKDFVKANKEMKKFFDIVEYKTESKNFSKGVEELTGDETKQITKIMIEIEEKADFASSPEGKKQKIYKEIKGWFNTYADDLTLKKTGFRENGSGAYYAKIASYETRIYEKHINNEYVIEYKYLYDGSGGLAYRAFSQGKVRYENIDDIYLSTETDPNTKKTYSAIVITLKKSYEKAWNWTTDVRNWEWDDKMLTKYKESIPVSYCDSKAVNELKELIKNYLRY